MFALLLCGVVMQALAELGGLRRCRYAFFMPKYGSAYEDESTGIEKSGAFPLTRCDSIETPLHRMILSILPYANALIGRRIWLRLCSRLVITCSWASS